MSVNVPSGETVTVSVHPDTMYTIGCVGHDEQGQDLCVEGNTTIITREQRHNKTLYKCIMHMYACIQWSAYNAPIMKCHIIQIESQYRNLFTGPPNVKNVTFGNTSVVNNVIWQDLSWSTVQLRNDDTKYLIKYVSSPRTATAQTNTASYTLKLEVPTSNTTVTVWVAATRNRALSDHGDFSDPQSITYTSMFCDHYLHCHDTPTDCHTHQLVLHYRSWSTSRPDTCQ